MDFRNDLETEVKTCKNDVENLMQVELGDVEVRPSTCLHMIYTVYRLNRQSDMYSAAGINSIFATGKVTIRNYFDSRKAGAYVFGLEESNTIYAVHPSVRNNHWFQSDKKSYEAFINQVAYHELGHIAHRKIVGSNLFSIWSGENREDIANYISLKLMSKEKWHDMPLQYAVMQSSSRLMPHGYLNQALYSQCVDMIKNCPDFDIVKHIRDRAELARAEVKENYPQLTLIQI